MQFKILFLMLIIGLVPYKLFVFAFKITGAISGIDQHSGAVPSRPEINGFATSGPAFDLYVLAMQAYQAVDQTDQFSYFQIAGIHGLPSVPWDGVMGRGSLPGYCMHTSVTFPLWHRPYLALFEQFVSIHAQNIAESYPAEQRAKYQAAALTLRVPYWDWAVSPELPQVFTTPNISVNGPTGWHQMKNPLYRYDFHPGPEGNGFYTSNSLSEARYTLRHADSQLMRSDEAEANQMLRSASGQILTDTYSLLSSTTDYTQFSTNRFDNHDNGAINIEAIHNNIHNWVGGIIGSMTHPEFAAFDPIFWLHHANVDRLVAMWQFLQPSSYIIPSVNEWGSYYESGHTVDTVNTPLAPFHSDDATTMYTPATVRLTTSFGYTYSELIGLNGSLQEQQANLRGRINALYSPTSTPKVHAAGGRIKRTGQISEVFRLESLDTIKEAGVNNLDMQWTVRIKLDQFVSAAPFSVYFFFGRPSNESTEWSSAPNMIGSYAQFRVANSLLDSRSSNDKIVTHGELSINHALVTAILQGSLQNLNPIVVVPLLRQHLHWKAKTHDNQEVHIDDTLGLTISVYSRKVKPRRRDNEFPVYGRYRVHPEVTAGKNGGLMADS